MNRGRRDTIFALSSGAPPAAIAIIRVSGPLAHAALQQLAGDVPEPRRAVVRELRASGEELLDTALVLRFEPPATATGEPIAELHVHGGRGVVAAILSALEEFPGLRPAEPGEFTRRAFENGRIDLAEAEGLADLLQAETESQRRAALALAGGALSRLVEGWRQRLLTLSAEVEAALDFADEDDLGEPLAEDWQASLDALRREMEAQLARPPAERLRDGIRIVLAGPPNSGKSSLFNAILEREAAIVSSIAGTTRDIIEAPIALAGTAFIFIDTAGLRESEDTIEEIGVARARDSLATADLILWLGLAKDAPAGDNIILVAPKADLKTSGGDLGVPVSARTGDGVATLVQLVMERAHALLPIDGEVALNARHRLALGQALVAIQESRDPDPIIIAEGLRRARQALDAVNGRAGVENMLDALFGRFCIGK